MKRIIGILILSVFVTAGAAACGMGSQEIAIRDPVAATSASGTQTDAGVGDAAVEIAASRETLAATADTAAGTDAGESAQAADTTPAMLCVYVCGEVLTPGVYSLPEGARIYEALALAGGLTAEADTAAVNQAQELSDGMMIRIPAVGDTSAGDAVQTADAGDAGTSKDAGLVNINAADAGTLETLPGIGQTKAAAIVAYREQHGNFTSKEELMNVSGIGESTYRNLESRIVIE